MTTLAIDVHDLRKSFGSRRVIDGLTLQVPEGEICGFLGGNGSGKTTTIRMLCGLLRPDGGGGTCLGLDLLRDAARIRLQIGYMTQRFSFYGDLTVAENLEFVARLYRIPNYRRAIAEVLDRIGLSDLVALPLLNWIIVHWTWHGAFGSLGLVGLVWCALWLVFGREGSLDNVREEADGVTPSSLRVSYAELLLSPTILACWAATFGANWALSLALSWQGAYLIKGLGLAQSSIGLLGALPASGSAVAMLAAGWYSQRLMSRGVSSRLARGILGGLSVVLGGFALAVLPYVPGPPSKLP